MNNYTKLYMAIFGDDRTIDGEYMPNLGYFQGIEICQLCEETLTAREAKILEYRFGLGEEDTPKTLLEVANEEGVTPERIRQIESKALRKLRHPTRACRIPRLSFYDTEMAKARTYVYRGLIFSGYAEDIARIVAGGLEDDELQAAIKSAPKSLEIYYGTISHCGYCKKALPPDYEFCDRHCKASYGREERARRITKRETGPIRSISISMDTYTLICAKRKQGESLRKTVDRMIKR